MGPSKDTKIQGERAEGYKETTANGGQRSPSLVHGLSWLLIAAFLFLSSPVWSIHYLEFISNAADVCLKTQINSSRILTQRLQRDERLPHLCGEPSPSSEDLLRPSHEPRWVNPAGRRRTKESKGFNFI